MTAGERPEGAEVNGGARPSGEAVAGASGAQAAVGRAERAPRFAIVNLGCKVNRVESDAFERTLRAAGWTEGPEAGADLVVVNTCTVTGEAEKKTRKAVRHALRAAPHARVVVTGCAAAIDPAAFEALDARVEVVPKAQVEARLSALRPDASEAPRIVAGVPEGSGGPATPATGAAPAGASRAPRAAVEPSSASRALGPRVRVGVKVQDGCDNACTYCIVHVARGAAWSRPAEEVAAEVVALARAGIPEIVLTGINLGSYADEGLTLAGLCERLLAATARLHAPGQPPCRLRIGSVEPQDVGDDLIELLARAEGRLCRHLHLPLQAGSSRVLAEMARPYDAAGFLALVGRLRAAVPQLALSTDVIVGFPGETDEDFAATCAVVREAGFSKVHVFPYSRRAGTPAADRADQVPPEVRARRAAELRALAAELRAADRARRAGAVELAVVESPGRATTESYHEIAVDPAHAPGVLVEVAL